MNSLAVMRLNIRHWSAALKAIKSELAFRRILRVAGKAGYRGDQPRDERGRWTSEGGVEVTEYGDFLTGIQSIDDASNALSDVLVRVIESLGPLEDFSPQFYGTMVHQQFASAVKSAGIPGVTDIERTFLFDIEQPRYGLADSIRTDVVLRNAAGEVMAIYDVKTGDARVRPSRAQELRDKTGVASNTPVFELNIVRGISRKFWVLRTDPSVRTLQPRLFWRGP